jgi:hypothetical protein
MVTNLAGDVCIGHYDVCYLRVGRLGPTCAPLYGANNGVITVGLVDLTASAEIREGADVEQTNGCGRTMFKVAKPDKVISRSLTGTIATWDYELLELLFGGTLILGAAGTNGAGKVIGWAEPSADSADKDPVVVEVIVKNAAEGEGACTSAAEDRPLYTGVIFPKVFATLGDYTANEGPHVVNFTGSSENNPNYGSGPWRDWDDASATVFPGDSPMVFVGYDDIDVFLNGAEDGSCGYQETPAAS